VIARAVELKAAVVARDERDGGVRKTLNVGHTIGHAIEAATHYTIRHGEAVSLGMAAESAIAVQMGLLDRRDFMRLVALLRAFRLPVDFPSVTNRRRFRSALAVDKKRDGASTGFVLLTGIGKVMIGVDVPSVFTEQLLAARSVLGNSYR
jgi:3-dehydroquinate synthase